VPPLLDYPNHLARAAVLAEGASDPVLSRMYAPHWAIIPNLGIDLILPSLLHLLAVHLAGRIVVGATILLPVCGTVAYSRALFGRYALWPLASGLVAYNATLLLGFLNFEAAIGIALLLAAGWLAWRERYPIRTAALAAVGAVALFFCHMMGLLFFGTLIAGHELEQFWRTRQEPLAILRRLTVLILVMAPPFALYLASPLAPLADETAFSSLADKAGQLVFPFANYILWLDVTTAAAVGAYLLVCLAMRRCCVTWTGALAIVLTALMFLPAPFAFKGTFFLDTRFVIMLGFLLFGALLPAGMPHVAAVAFATLFAIRMAVVVVVWFQYRDDLADLRTAIAAVQPGDRVFIATVSPEEAPAYWQDGPLARRLSVGLRLDSHLPALLLIEHRAYWPFLFDNPSQQPVETLSPYRELAERAGSIADHRELVEPGGIDLCGFTHLLLLEAGGEPDLAHFAPNRLVLLDRTGYAALFRVTPAPCASKSAMAPSGARL
jgi:hypothetical protein